MKLTKVICVGLLAVGLSACGTKSTKTIFGRQSKNGPAVASSVPNFVLPNHLHATKVHTLYPAPRNVSQQQPQVSLVPPGSNLGQYVKKQR